MARLPSFPKASGLSGFPPAYTRAAVTVAGRPTRRAPREGAVPNSWLGHHTVNLTALLWILTGCLVCPAARALTIPAGTEVQIRLKTKVSTTSSHVKDPVEAVVIAPVMAGGVFAVPAGAAVHAAVAKVASSIKPDERAVLALSFTTLEFGGTKHPLAARLIEVDNAREKVDDQGQVQGILASDTITGKLDEQIGKVTEKYAGLGGFLNQVKSAVLQPAQDDITYDAGVEMTLKLTAALVLKNPGGAGPAAKLRPMPDEAALLALVAREPFQTVAQKPPKPSDLTNLMLIGSEAAVREAFSAAGWTAATNLNPLSKFETLRALAEDRGYSEAPVSILMLDGRPPDMVFEKLNNTFAHRHHLRIWRRPETFLGQPVWAVAATHDIGINFSQQDRTFIHRVDPRIDGERAKVVTDLLFTGKVQSVELVDRPAVPVKTQNATGDTLETDGRLAVLVLQ
ncbi:MAG TPA: LssY C-terminal domain-containing protein [Bryobacteraceae bacterium]|nr:LssY C-terminal domain-containing protein [Bryobacteraceae bacterium]